MKNEVCKEVNEQLKLRRQPLVQDEWDYINPIASIFKNAHKSMGELLDGTLEVTFYEWIIADFSLCKGPGIKKRIGRRVVMYNKAEQKIFIKNFTSCKLNEVCGIYNEVKWRG